MGKKKAVGRPLKALKDLPKNWQKGVMDLAEVGASDVELRGFLDISKQVWYRFLEEDEEFTETIARCARSCQIWWERHGRLNLDCKEFNTQLWFLNMKNRFKGQWADKQEVDLTSKGDKIELVERVIKSLPK
jgi:hypothetical protein